ncbi:MAG: hypothetical protein K0S76_1614 [Herbinix sp.]|jgi:LCP family protein required for cell wall assembly|nr:hypothetical protein [Herbinix sp.]
MQGDKDKDNQFGNKRDQSGNTDTDKNIKKGNIIEDEILDTFAVDQDFDIEEDISESLRLQVQEELGIQENETGESKKEKKKRLIKRILISTGIVLCVLIAFSAWMVGTKTGRKLLYRLGGNYIYGHVDNDEITPIVTPNPQDNDNVGNDSPTGDDEVAEVPDPIDPRKEDFVTNFLIFGIEEIEGARNTDSIMLASINTRDKSVKLTSLLRDTYIQVPGDDPTKLNAVYTQGGSDLLVKVIEYNYRIKIDGYAHVNFEAFEKIVDRLDGIDIELGEEEAHYLNTTNYISKRSNRNVKPGWNHLNGNQALGYCRVRKVETLGGANDDYGRSLRQRRVLKAIFNQYKSQSFFNLFDIMNECLGYVKTNISASQFENGLEAVVENKITTLNNSRIPANNMFETPGEYNGVDDPLVLDWDKNIVELYQFIFGDTEEEAKAELAEQRK